MQVILEEKDILNLLEKALGVAIDREKVQITGGTKAKPLRVILDDVLNLPVDAPPSISNPPEEDALEPAAEVPTPKAAPAPPPDEPFADAKAEMNKLLAISKAMPKEPRKGV